MANESNVNILLNNIPALKNLLDRKRIPILFIGSGISKRYIGLNSWTSLLKDIAKDIGISQSMYVGLIEQSKSESGEDNYLPTLALKLSRMMVDKLVSGGLNSENFPIFSTRDWARSESGESPFKILISKHICSYKLTEDLDLLDEIKLFRELEEKIPVVITTNYDTFLEDHIFKNFDIRVCPDDLYFSRFEGVGELLKIHGTVTDPNSMIITKEDYDNLKEKFKITTARITSLLCDHPVIFIGYSLNDTEIISLINDMVSCLKYTDQSIIQDNIIQIAYDEKNEDAKYRCAIKEVSLNGKTIRITQIYTNEILTVLEYLNLFEPHMRPRDVRNLKGIISELILTKGPGKPKCRLVGLDDLSAIDTEDVVVAVGPGNTMDCVLNIISGFDPIDALEDVLNDNKSSILNMSKDVFFKWVNNFKNNPPYLPIDYFMKKNNLSEDDLPQTVKNIRNNQLTKLYNHIGALAKKHPNNIKKEDIPQYINEQTNYGNRYNAIAYFYWCNIINREDCRKFIDMLLLKENKEHLQRIIEKEGLQKEGLNLEYPLKTKKMKMTTEARKAIVLLDVPNRT